MQREKPPENPQDLIEEYLKAAREQRIFNMKAREKQKLTNAERLKAAEVGKKIAELNNKLTPEMMTEVRKQIAQND